MSPSARLQILVWPAVLAYVGWLVPHAVHELNDEAVVQGLFRAYHPPYPLPAGGHVVDARPLELAGELSQRFGLAPSRPAPAGDDVEAWRAWLTAAGLRPTDRRARDRLTHPRLLWQAGRPRLVLGTLDRDYVVLLPEHGVSLLPEVALGDGPALDLDRPLERRWTPAFQR